MGGTSDKGGVPFLMGELDPSKHLVHWKDSKYTEALLLVWTIHYVKSGGKSNQTVNQTPITWDTLAIS